MILVGPTGLDAALRHDPGVELIRARTPLDALGELADPIDADSPSRAVVIVDPGVEPEATGPGDLTEFLAGLRRVDPAVRVLRVSRNGAVAPDGYDGLVEPGIDAAALRRFIANGTGAPHQAIEPKPTPAASVEPSPAAPARPAMTEPTAPPAAPTPEPVAVVGGGSKADELVLLGRLAAGEPIRDEAVARLKIRVGADDLQFVGLEDSRPDLGPHSAAPVRTEGYAFGALVSTSLSPAELAGAAEWLGAWLALERKQENLREAAFRDPLTGAWNRRYFDQFLPEAIELARQGRRDLTMLLFDIDDFKRFNDEHGHAAGDEILTECVRLLNTAVRPTDKVCRIGGDEFAVIFHEPEGPREPDSRHPTDVFDIAERFRGLVCEARFRKLGDDAPGKLTISGGLATFPWDGRTAAELIERADELALEGKKQGKNVIAIGPGIRRPRAGG